MRYFTRVVSKSIDKGACVILSLTTRCNLKCTNCIERHRMSVRRDMSVEVVKHLDKLGDIGTVVLYGGEPGLNPNFAEIVDSIDGSVNISLCTNGYTFNRYRELLAKRHVSVELTLHRDNYKKILDLYNKNKDKFDISLSVVCTRDFIAQCKAIKQLYPECYVHYDKFDPQMVNIVRGFSELETVNADRFDIDTGDLVEPDNRMELYCSAGTKLFFIVENGDVYRCVHTYGHEEPLFNILTDAPRFVREKCNDIRHLCTFDCINIELNEK